MPVTVGSVAVVSAAIYGGYLLFCYLFFGFGLYVMAKKRNMKTAFLAWIPVASVYLIGLLAGEVRFFGVKAKWIAIAVLVIEVAVLVFRAVSDVILIPLLQDVWGRALNGETYEYIYESILVNEQGAEISRSLGVMYTRYYTGLLLGGISAAVSGIYSLAGVILIYLLFLNYSPRSAWIFAILSFFIPVLKPVLVFVVRKNTSGEYREYMKMKMHSMYGGGNPYAYGDGKYKDPYDLSEKGEKKGEQPESPFGEFGDKN